MTIPSTPAAAGPYATDGTTTSFPFEYKSFGVGYHAVVKDTGGTLVSLAYGTDFAVTQNADQDVNPGGNVLISPALPAGSTISIYSNVPYEQPTQLPTGGRFFASAVMDALDRVVTLIKQGALATTGGTLLPSDRSLRVQTGETINELPLAAGRLNSVLKFDNSGNATVAPYAEYQTTVTIDTPEALRLLDASAAVVFREPDEEEPPGVVLTRAGDIAVLKGLQGVSLRAGEIEGLRVDASGNAGIGGTPTTKFEVFGALGNVQVTANGAGVVFTRPDANYLDAGQTGGFLIFRTNGVSEAMRIDASGAVQQRVPVNPGAIANGFLNIALPTDTTLRFWVRGADGVVRYGDLALNVTP